MLSQSIWIVAFVLEGFLFIRSFFCGLFQRYPYFYVYIGFVFVQDALRMFFYMKHPEMYPQMYWSTQFLGLLFGCGVLWEIYRGTLSAFPGARRIARNILGILVVILLVKAALSHGFWTANRAILTTLDVERDLRLVQAMLLAALVSVFTFYKLSLGGNLRALVFGYGVFLATSVVNLAIRGQIGERFQLTWQLLQPALYIVVLSVWNAGMWSYSPMEMSGSVLKIAANYKLLARSTRIRLEELRSHVNKGIRA